MQGELDKRSTLDLTLLDVGKETGPRDESRGPLK